MNVARSDRHTGNQGEARCWSYKPESVLNFDLHIDACGELKLHQRINCLVRRVENVDEALMGSHFKLFSRFLVNVGRPQDSVERSLRRQRYRTRHDCTGRFHRLDDFLCRLIDQCMIVRFQFDAYLLSGHWYVPYLQKCYSMIFVTTPAPTVCPPSRIAKRRPSSIAIGEISSTAILSMLSPGMTISVPPGSVETPVTSVVRK